ncbi:MAG: hypothetical protein ACK4L8_02535 [Nitrincola lacisaponensis]|uniref:hypothetical protein n=1 Tax=Nitrincola lacisaponensis TaxID=267850 RepID=UPI00391BDDCD
MFYKIGSVLLLGILVSGCIKTDNLLQRDPTSREYYKLDTRDLRLCRGETTNCFGLSHIASARHHLRPMEARYGQRVNGPNYPVNFARMLINPPAGSYTAEQVSDRYYHLPVNEWTDTAWESLENVYKAHYDRRL